MTSIMARKNKWEWIAVIPGIVLVLILLEAGSYIKDDRLIFPSTGEIGREFLSLLREQDTWRQISTTLLHLLEAFALSACIGIVLGIAEGLIPYLHTLLKPLMTLLRSLPMIIMVIILMVLVQSYRTIPVTAGCMIVIPMISEAGYEGCIRIDPELIDVYRMNSGISLRVILQVYLPLMGGYMKQAFVNAFDTGLKVIVTAEYLVQTKDSLGKIIFQKYKNSDFSVMYAYALIMILLVILLTGLPQLVIMTVERRKKKEITTG